MNFFISYGLRPWKEGDCEAALSISRALKKGNNNNDSRGGRKEGNQFGVGKSGGVCYDPSLLVTRYKELLQVSSSLSLFFFFSTLLLLFFFFFFPNLFSFEAKRRLSYSPLLLYPPSSLP